MRGSFALAPHMRTSSIFLQAPTSSGHSNLDIIIRHWELFKLCNSKFSKDRSNICHDVQLPIPSACDDRPCKSRFHVVFHTLLCVELHSILTVSRLPLATSPQSVCRNPYRIDPRPSTDIHLKARPRGALL